jgi:hypothetical protein
MKSLDYLYFNFYKWYLRMKLNGRKIEPSNLAALALAMGSALYTAVIFGLVWLKVLHRTTDITKGYVQISAIAITLLFYALYKNLYVDNWKYLKVYEAYKDSPGMGKMQQFLSFFIVLLLPLTFVVLYIFLS